MNHFAIILLAVSLNLSAYSQTFRTVPPPSPVSSMMRSALAAVPVPPPTNHGWSVPLTWEVTNHPAISGVRVYASTNRIEWRRIGQFGLATNFTATNIFLPQNFVVRYYATNGMEGPDSNVLTVLGRETVVVVAAQTSTNLTRWDTIATVYQRTNSLESTRWFRNDIRAVQQFTVQ